MALPLTITGLYTSLAVLGPFRASNGSTYLFGRDASTSTTLQAYKSTNPSTTPFASIATKTGYSTSINYCNGKQIGDVVHIIVCDGTGTSSNFKYATFNMATDAFVLSETIVTGVDTRRSDNTPQLACSLVVQKDGVVRANFTGLRYRVQGKYYSNVASCKRTGVNTWSTPFQLGSSYGDIDRTLSPVALNDWHFEDGNYTHVATTTSGLYPGAAATSTEGYVTVRFPGDEQYGYTEDDAANIAIVPHYPQSGTTTEPVDDPFATARLSWWSGTENAPPTAINVIGTITGGPDDNNTTSVLGVHLLATFIYWENTWYYQIAAYNWRDPPDWEYPQAYVDTPRTLPVPDILEFGPLRIFHHVGRVFAVYGHTDNKLYVSYTDNFGCTWSPEQVFYEATALGDSESMSRSDSRGLFFDYATNAYYYGYVVNDNGTLIYNEWFAARANEAHFRGKGSLVAVMDGQLPRGELPKRIDLLLTHYNYCVYGPYKTSTGKYYWLGTTNRTDPNNFDYLAPRAFPAICRAIDDDPTNGFEFLLAADHVDWYFSYSDPDGGRHDSWSSVQLLNCYKIGDLLHILASDDQTYVPPGTNVVQTETYKFWYLVFDMVNEVFTIAEPIVEIGPYENFNNATADMCVRSTGEVVVTYSDIGTYYHSGQTEFYFNSLWYLRRTVAGTWTTPLRYTPVGEQAFRTGLTALLGSNDRVHFVFSQGNSYYIDPPAIVDAFGVITLTSSNVLQPVVTDSDWAGDGAPWIDSTNPQKAISIPWQGGRRLLLFVQGYYLEDSGGGYLIQRDVNYVTYFDSADTVTLGFKTDNGGETWGAMLSQFYWDNDFATLWESKGGNPGTYWDPELGYVYYNWAQLQVRYSIDGGATWSYWMGVENASRADFFGPRGTNRETYKRLTEWVLPLTFNNGGSYPDANVYYLYHEYVTHSQLQYARAKFTGAGTLKVNVIKPVKWQIAAKLQGAGALVPHQTFAKLSSPAKFQGAGTLRVLAKKARFADASFSGEGTLVCSSGPMHLSARSSFVGDGVVVPNVRQFVSGVYDETGEATTEVTLPPDTETEYEFGLILELAQFTTNDVVSFRLMLDDVPLDVYEEEPSFVIVGTAGQKFGRARFSGSGTLKVDTLHTSEVRGAYWGDSGLQVDVQHAPAGEALLIGEGLLTSEIGFLYLGEAHFDGVGNFYVTRVNVGFQQGLFGEGWFGGNATHVTAGTALFSGASGLTVRSRQNYAVRFHFQGAGELHATPWAFQVPGEASFVGVGSFIAAPLHNPNAAAVFAGAGRLVQLPVLRQPVYARFAGQGDLDARLLKHTRASANFVAWSFLRVNGVWAKHAEGKFQGVGTLKASTRDYVPAQAHLAGASTLVVDSRLELPTALLAGVGAFTVAAAHDPHARARFAAVGALRVAATPTINGRARFAGTSTFKAAARYGRGAFAHLAGVGSLKVSSKKASFAQALLAGIGTLTVRSQLELPAALFAGVGNFQAAAGFYQEAKARFVGTGTLTVQQTYYKVARARLAGVGALTVRQTYYKAARAKFTGAGTLKATAQQIYRWTASARLAGVGALTVHQTYHRLISARLAGVGALTPHQIFARAARVLLAGSGTLKVSSKVVYHNAAIFLGAGTFKAAARRALLAQALFDGSSSLNVDGTVPPLRISLAGSGQLAVDGFVSVFAKARFAGAGLFKSKASRTRPLAAKFLGAGLLKARITQQAAARFLGNSTLKAVAKRYLAGQALLAGTGALQLDATVPPLRITLSGAGDLHVDSFVAVLARARFAGIGTFKSKASRAWATRAKFVGAGLLKSRITQQAAARFLGSSTLKAVTKARWAGVASLAGSSSLRVDGSVPPLRIMLSGVGELHADSFKATLARARFAGAGLLKVWGSRARPAAAKFLGAGTLKTRALLQARTAAKFSGVGTLVVRTREYELAAAAFAGVGRLVGVAQTYVPPIYARFAGVGDFDAQALHTPQAKARFAGVGAFKSRASRTRPISAKFTGAGTLKVKSALARSAQARFAGIGTLRVKSRYTAEALAALAGAGQFKAKATHTPRAAAGLEGSGAVDGNAAHTPQGRIKLVGAGAVAVSTVVVRTARVALTGRGQLVTLATARRTASANLRGTGSMTTRSEMKYLVLPYGALVCSRIEMNALAQGAPELEACPFEEVA